MILADTSVWIDHLRAGDEGLVTLLNSAQVLIHSFTRDEMACGKLRMRSEVLTLLGDLPRATAAADAELLFTIERHGLMGRGIGYVDAHPLAAVPMASPARLWTRDQRLGSVAAELGLAHEG
ncbi:MAG: type II toxin-antitoxin system VapC family toxin [Chloroflexi bacterium]|nr:type II toxin-antitoxin system VapC family toxin [Chloroflexota bacterium]